MGMGDWGFDEGNGCPPGAVCRAHRGGHVQSVEIPQCPHAAERLVPEPPGGEPGRV